MPYISLDNLTQYNGRLRDYIDGSFDKLDGANWRKTSAGQSVSCWPIPESPLEPEVAFKFSEVPPESGTKGPDNPSTIVGVESVSCNVCESEGVSDTPYSIDLGGTYYGGTVNFATGVLTVEWWKHEFDGNEIWRENGTVGSNYRHWVLLSENEFPIPVIGSSYQACSHCAYSYSFNNALGLFFASGAESGGGIFFCDKNAVYSTTEDWTIWLASEKLAGHPVTVVYNLATPLTVALTPVLVRSLPALSHYTPRQNTIYTSHESVQVGYAKSASKTSQDLANAIVALGGNV